jgi:HlyD family secretion protein
MRRTLFTIIVVAVIVLVVAAVGQRLFTRSTGDSAPAALGEFSPRAAQEIKSRGIVTPLHWAELSFPVSGQLAKLVVAPGEDVSTGYTLAWLETEDLELQVQLAQSELALQEADLAQMQEGPSEAELAAAQAGYEAAVTAYEKLQAGLTPEEMIVAEADLKRAEVALQRAQAAYDAVSSSPDIAARPESMQLESATIDYQRAKATYALTIAEPDEAALKQAESLVASTKAQLQALQESAPPSDVRAAEASVVRAEANLARTQLTLEQATLCAPFDGTVTSVTDAQLAQIIPAGTTILTLADLSQLQVETTDLDEWGVANIALGQTVDLLVPGLANRSLRGHLVFVSSEPTITSSGAVFYKAIVALDEEEPQLRWGMTVLLEFGTVGD